jgi:sugar transferase (PEP-CTERM/EpsH1 system associated)
MPLKIVHVVHSLEVGGLENGVVNLINRLDGGCFTQVVCCLKGSGKLAERIERKDVEIIELGLSADGFRFPVLKLSRVFRRIAPHMVHTRGWGTVDAVFAARLAGVPRVVHGEHGREWDDREGSNWKRNQIRRLVGLMVNRYVVVCKFFHSWLRQKCRVAEKKILHIPNGVDTTKFHPLCAERKEQSPETRFALGALRARLGLPVEGVLLGSVGRLDPVKDFPTLLKAFAKARRDFPKAHLVVVGDGPLRRALASLAAELGLDSSVHWLGEREDVALLYRCFDLFVQASLFEGMSNTILEAMASGLAVVATDTGGNSELITSGENGRLVPVGDSESLARALSDYLRDSSRRQAHGQKSREIAAGNFDLSLMASRYAGLYREVISGHR